MRNLWPPINVIASNLNPSDTDIRHFQAEGLQEEEGVVEMPAFIREKVRQRIASRQAKFDPMPKAGQVLRFDDSGQGVPKCVLLDKEESKGRWHGWIVAPETDYATDQDVLLEPVDEPFDPLAGMVQTWNRVEVDAGKAARVLAQLSEARMAAIREVAQGECADGGGARPGFVAPLATLGGRSVLTGTRIAHPQDSRNTYRSLYAAAAKRLQSTHQPKAEIILFRLIKKDWHNAGWAIAATVFIAQSALIVNLLNEREETKGDLTMEQLASEYRSTPVPELQYAYLQVIFKPDAKIGEIQKLLTKLNANIIEGPDSYGQYKLEIAKSRYREVEKAIAESDFTFSAIKVPK